MRHQLKRRLQMDKTVYVFLGWLLGIAAITIEDYIRRRIRSAQIGKSVDLELQELRFLMAAIALNMRMRQGRVTREFLTWFQPIAQGHDGLDPRVSEFLPKIREMPEDELNKVLLSFRRPNAGVQLNEHSLPFLASLAGDVAVLPAELQRDLWRVKLQLDLFNQQTCFLRGQFDKTFDESLSEANRRSVQTNLDEGYTRIGDRAEGIARIITDSIH